MGLFYRFSVELLRRDMVSPVLGAAKGAIEGRLRFEPSVGEAVAALLGMERLALNCTGLFEYSQTNIFALDVGAFYQFLGGHTPAVVSV